MRNYALQGDCSNVGLKPLSSLTRQSRAINVIKLREKDTFEDEKKSNITIIGSLKVFLLLSIVPTQYKQTPTDFTRNRKLPFPNLVTLMFKTLRKKIGLEINIFYDKLVLLALEEQQASLTASAFCQSRQKLKSEFFRSRRIG